MKKGEEPLISVCVLTYNHGRYIEDCLKSIMNTDYDNLELIIYDDHSPDDTQTQIKAMVPKLEKRCVSVSLELSDSNRGNIPGNINRMIKKVKGEYIKTLSGDDCLTKNYFTRMMEYYSENPDKDIVFSNYQKVSDDFIYDSTKKDWKNSAEKVPDLNSENLFFNLMLGNYLNAPSAIIRRSVFERIGYYDNKAIYEDYEFWLRCALNHIRFGYIDEPLIIYRVAATSISIFDSRDDKKVKRWLDATFYIKNKYSKYLAGIEYYIFTDTYYLNLSEYYQAFSENIKQYIIEKVKCRTWVKGADSFFSKPNVLTTIEGYDEDKINEKFSEFINYTGITKVGIYGFGIREINIFNHLLLNGIREVFFVSEKAKEEFVKEKLDKLKAYSPNETLPACDAIIFADEQLCLYMRHIMKDKDIPPLVSIYDILFFQ